MLYFHPWEFDPAQERLPLRGLSRFRTYVGLTRTRGRLAHLLARHRFARAVDVASELDGHWGLTEYSLTASDHAVPAKVAAGALRVPATCGA